MRTVQYSNVWIVEAATWNKWDWLNFLNENVRMVGDTITKLDELLDNVDLDTTTAGANVMILHVPSGNDTESKSLRVMSHQRNLVKTDFGWQDVGLVLALSFVRQLIRTNYVDKRPLLIHLQGVSRPGSRLLWFKCIPNLSTSTSYRLALEHDEPGVVCPQNVRFVFYNPH